MEPVRSWAPLFAHLRKDILYIQVFVQSFRAKWDFLVGRRGGQDKWSYAACYGFSVIFILLCIN